MKPMFFPISLTAFCGAFDFAGTCWNIQSIREMG
jgi:hypothetical protein